MYYCSEERLSILTLLGKWDQLYSVRASSKVVVSSMAGKHDYFEPLTYFSCLKSLVGQVAPKLRNKTKWRNAPWKHLFPSYWKHTHVVQQMLWDSKSFLLLIFTHFYLFCFWSFNIRSMFFVPRLIHPRCFERRQIF